MNSQTLTKSWPLAVLAIALAISAGSWAQPERKPHDPEAWEPTIQKFEEQDRQTPPPRKAVLFLGSSSIRGWNVQKYFPGYPVINRGFGGSHIEDSLYYLDRIALIHQPRVIVFYAGDNDITAGKPPEEVAEDFKTLARKVFKSLPRTRIVFISIKPSIARWKYVDLMRQANALIEAYCRTDRRLKYVDIDAPMLDADGRPRAELLQSDGLHLSPAGYELWTGKVMPYLGVVKKSHTKSEGSTPGRIDP